MLDRDLARVSALETIDPADSLLTELVNDGTHTLTRCSVVAGQERDVDLAPLLLYRHLLELTDGIHVLLHQSCAQAAIPLLRAAFEASLGLEFLVGDDAAYEKRARSWLCAYLDRERRAHRRIDTSSRAGREFEQGWRAEFGEWVPAFVEEAARTRASEVEHLLERADFADVWHEYRRCRRVSNGRPNWYSLFGGPRHVRALAERLRRLLEYQVVYERWSVMIHAGEVSAYAEMAMPGGAALRRLRAPDELGRVVLYAANFLLGAKRHILGRFRSGEDLRAWYEREVRDLFLRFIPSDQEDTGQPA